MSLFKKSAEERAAAADLRETRELRVVNRDLERRAGITHQTGQDALLASHAADAKARVRQARRNR